MCTNIHTLRVWIRVWNCISTHMGWSCYIEYVWIWTIQTCQSNHSTTNFRSKSLSKKRKHVTFDFYSTTESFQIIAQRGNQCTFITPRYAFPKPQQQHLCCIKNITTWWTVIVEYSIALWICWCGVSIYIKDDNIFWMKLDEHLWTQTANDIERGWTQDLP